MRAAEFLAAHDLRDDAVEFRAVAGECVGSVLEAGCAFGAFTDYLLPAMTYVGIDISRLAIQNARGLHPGRLFLYGDALHLGQGWSKCVDTVIAMQFLEHCSNPVWALAKLRSYARRRVIFTVPQDMPTDEQRKIMGHVNGWESWESLCETLQGGGRKRLAPLDVAENHWGGVLSW